MRATLHQLRVFQQVAAVMSYTEAASLLRLTQPAVSIQIKQLETNLDMPLLEKIGKKLFLTPAGQELEHFCGELFENIERMDMRLSAMKGSMEGELRLAAVTSAKYFTPHLLGAFHKLHPTVKLQLEVVNRSQIIRRLKDNADDLVIMGLVPESMRLTCHPFVDNPIVIVASPSHPPGAAEKHRADRSAGAHFPVSGGRFRHARNHGAFSAKQECRAGGRHGAGQHGNHQAGGHGRFGHIGGFPAQCHPGDGNTMPGRAACPAFSLAEKLVCGPSSVKTVVTCRTGIRGFYFGPPGQGGGLVQPLSQETFC